VPNHWRGASADADVDLVEDQRRPRLGPRQDCLQGQRDARQLATRGDARHRPRLIPRVGRDQELDVVDAGRIEGQAT
jgi:hypothetical protein